MPKLGICFHISAWCYKITETAGCYIIKQYLVLQSDWDCLVLQNDLTLPVMQAHSLCNYQLIKISYEKKKTWRLDHLLIPIRFPSTPLPASWKMTLMINLHIHSYSKQPKDLYICACPKCISVCQYVANTFNICNIHVYSASTNFQNGVDLIMT